MRHPRFLLAILFVSAFAVPAIARDDETKETAADLPSQAAADALKAAASTDGAFIAAGMIKDGFDKTQDLSALLLYPEDQVMVVKLTGEQVRQALERSVVLYPTPNTSFLQLSGFDVTFNKNASDGHRVTTVTVNGGALVNTSSYTIAMPARLAQGGYGYFKIWDKPDIVKTLENTTVESVLKGKRYTDSSPRWHAVSSPVARH